MGVEEDNQRRQAEEDAAASAAAGTPQTIPDLSVKTEGAQTTVNRTNVAPEYAAEVNAQRAANQEEMAAQVAGRGAQLEQGALDQKQAHATANQAQEDFDRLTEARAKEDEKIEAAKAEAQRRRAQMEKDAKPTTYWQDKGAPAQLFSIFMTGLSEASNVTTGAKYGESPLAKQYEALLAKDEASKLRAFENSKYFSELADKDVALAEKAKADKIAEIKDEHIVMGDILAKRFKAYGAKIGTEAALAKTDEAIAHLDAANHKSLAEQEKVRNSTVSTAGPKTTETKNTINPKEKGLPAATSKDIEDRRRLVVQSEAAREFGRIGLNNPAAMKDVQSAMKHFGFNLSENGGIVGKISEAALRAIGKPGSVDDALKDADPDSRRAFVLLQERISAKAKARGSAITDSDVTASLAELGVYGQTPKEISRAAFLAADNDDKYRTSLEKNKRFRDETEKHPGEIDSPGEEQRRHENRQGREDRKAKALADLVKSQHPSAKEFILGGHQDIQKKAAEEAWAAGLSEDLIRKYVSWYRKPKGSDE